MKHLTHPDPRTVAHLYLVLSLALVLGLAACTEKLEEDGGSSALPSSCPLSLPPAPFKTMSSQGTGARSYSEQPQVVVWEESQPGVQAMSLGLRANYVVVYDKACAASGSKMAFPEVRSQLLGGALNYAAFEVSVDTGDLNLRSEVSRDKCIKSLTPNQTVSIQGVRPFSFTPDDTLFTDQKHHDFLQSLEAWDIFYDGDNGISGGAGDVIVAIVDTGINLSHEDIAGQLWDDGGGGHGINFFTCPMSDPDCTNQNSDDPSDDNGHGTHVAGLVAAAIENGKGGAGIAPRDVKLMAVKALGGSQGTGSVTAVINAVTWAAQNGAHVINLSLGIGGTAAGLRAAIEDAIAGGTFVAAAAGNANQEVSSLNPVSPAMYAKDLAGFVSVGSLDTETGEKSSFSNYSSSYVEIFAPGSRGLVQGLGTIGLWSTVDVGSYSPYEDFNGTSMATPVVAGAAALAIAYYREWGKAWTPAVIEQHLKDSSLQKCQLWDYGEQGRYLNLKQLAEDVSAAVLP